MLLLTTSLIQAPLANTTSNNQGVPEANYSKILFQTTISTLSNAIASSALSQEEISDDDLKDLLKTALKTTEDQLQQDDTQKNDYHEEMLKTYQDNKQLFGGRLANILSQNKDEFSYENIKRYQVQTSNGFFAKLGTIFLKIFSKISDEAAKNLQIKQIREELAKNEQLSADQVKQDFPEHRLKRYDASNEQEDFSILQKQLNNSPTSKTPRISQDSFILETPNLSLPRPQSAPATFLDPAAKMAREQDIQRKVLSQFKTQIGGGGGADLPGELPLPPSRTSSSTSLADSDDFIRHPSRVSLPSILADSDGAPIPLSRSSSTNSFLEVSDELPIVTDDDDDDVLTQELRASSSSSSFGLNFDEQNDDLTPLESPREIVSAGIVSEVQTSLDPAQKFTSLEDAFWRIHKDPSLLEKNLDELKTELNLDDESFAVMKKTLTLEKLQQDDGSVSVELENLGLNKYRVKKLLTMMETLQSMKTIQICDTLIANAQVNNALKSANLNKLVANLQRGAPGFVLNGIVNQIWDETKSDEEQKKALADLYAVKDSSIEKYVSSRKNLVGFDLTEKMPAIQMLILSGEEQALDSVLAVVDRNTVAASQALPFKDHPQAGFDYFSTAPRNYFSDTDINHPEIEVFQSKDPLLMKMLQNLRDLEKAVSVQNQDRVTKSTNDFKAQELMHRSDQFKMHLLSLGICKQLAAKVNYQPTIIDGAVTQPTNQFWKEVDLLEKKLSLLEDKGLNKDYLDQFEEELGKTLVKADSDPFFHKIDLVGNLQNFDSEVRSKLMADGQSLTNPDQVAVFDLAKRGAFDSVGIDAKVSFLATSPAFLDQSNKNANMLRKMDDQETLKKLQNGDIFTRQAEQRLLDAKSAKVAVEDEFKRHAKLFDLDGDNEFADAMSVATSAARGFDATNTEQIDRIHQALLLEDMVAKVNDPASESLHDFVRGDDIKLKDFSDQRDLFARHLLDLSKGAAGSKPFWDPSTGEQLPQTKYFLIQFTDILTKQETQEFLKRQGIAFKAGNDIEDLAATASGLAPEQAMIRFQGALAQAGTKVSQEQLTEISKYFMTQPGVRDSFRLAANENGLLHGKALPIKDSNGEITGWVDSEKALKKLQKVLKDPSQSTDLLKDFNPASISPLKALQKYVEITKPNATEQIKNLQQLNQAIEAKDSDKFRNATTALAFDASINDVARKIALGVNLKKRDNRGQAAVFFEPGSKPFLEIQRQIRDDLRLHLKSNPDAFGHLKSIDDAIGDIDHPVPLAKETPSAALKNAWFGGADGNSIQESLKGAFAAAGLPEGSVVSDLVVNSGTFNTVGDLQKAIQARVSSEDGSSKPSIPQASLTQAISDERAPSSRPRVPPINLSNSTRSVSPEINLASDDDHPTSRSLPRSPTTSRQSSSFRSTPGAENAFEEPLTGNRPLSRQPSQESSQRVNSVRPPSNRRP